MNQTRPPSKPSPAKVVTILRDGYWDRTEIIELPDASLRVRKTSKGAAASGPWARNSLRSEIQYLKDLEPDIARHFPVLLAAWDDQSDMGYEMSFVAEAIDVSSLAQSTPLDQRYADTFQQRLGRIIFESLHKPAKPVESLADHVHEVITAALTKLGRLDEFAPVLTTATVTINGEKMTGPRQALARIVQAQAALLRLDQQPQVRLHGDCFLENILVPRTDRSDPRPSRIILLDPVSVAGIYQGHPLFDLVKYESCATGELLALRSEKILVKGFSPHSQTDYRYRPCLDDANLRPFRQVDWQSRFRAAYIDRYGSIDWTAYHLFDAYFAFAMAMCTSGLQRRGRVLKGIIALNAASTGAQ